MEILKRTLSALLVQVMVLGMLPMNTRAEEVVETIPAETVAETEAVETVPETEVSETIEVMVEEEAEPVLADAAKTEAYIQNLINSGETEIYIDDAIVLENNFILPGNVMLTIRNGGSVTVPAGKTLTSDGGRINIWAGGAVFVEAGGTLNNWGYMDVSGTLENHGTFEGQVHTYYNFSNPTFVGINDQQIWMHYVVEGDDPDANQAKFLEHWALMESTNYGGYSQQIHGDLTLPSSITIPSNCYVVLEVSELTFTIPTGVMVTNKGTFNSYQDQTVQNNGVFENAGQINIQGPWLGNPVTAAKMTQDDLEAAIAENAEKGWSYHLTNEVILERDLILEDGQLQIGSGGKLIAPGGIIFRAQAGIMVQPGGTLVAHADFAEDGMISIVYDNGSMGKVTGIPESKLSMYYYVYSQEEFTNDIQVALDTNFAGDYLYIWENVTLSKDTTIDEKTVVHMYGGKTLTVPADKTLTIKGGLCIWEGQTLVNNGTIDNYGFLDNWGTVTNNGTVNVNTPAGYGGLSVYEPALVQNSGAVNVYDHAIFVDGTWKGNPWNNLIPKDETYLQKLIDMGRTTIWADADLTITKDFTVPADVTLNIDGGSVTVSEGVTLTNEGVICIENGNALQNDGTIDNTGLLDNRGTVVNNGAINNNGNITNNGTWEGKAAQKKMTQDQLEAAMAQADSYNLTAEVTLERDMTINKWFYIKPGAKLIVPKNVKLTIAANVAVLNGGTLDIQGEYELIPPENASEHRSIFINWENGVFSTVNGVNAKDMTLECVVNNEQQFADSLKLCEDTNYASVNIYICSGVTLSSSKMIPEKCFVHLYATVTVPTGMTLTNKGDIYIWNGQTLQNDSSIENDGRIHVVGQLTNNGVINVKETNGQLLIDPAGAVQNNGTVNVYGLIDGPGMADGKPTFKWEGNEPVYPHVHAYTETVTAPTCTEKGYTTYTCECGDSYVDNYVDATGHSFGDWYVTKEATVDAEGEEHRDCAACDHFETRAIPKVEIPTEGQCGGSLTWSYDKTTGTLTITGSGAMWNFTISLKQKSADPMVPWAAYQSEIKAVVLSEGITSIGNNAFAGCENLTEVTLPKTVTTIGEGAFLDSGLKEITFQGDAPEVSESAFQGVSATITYPQDNETWTEDKKQDFGGNLTWDEPENDHGYQLGDVNHDGKINAKDATLILQKSVGVLKETAKFCEDCAEVSGDGKLNAKDSTLILQFSVGLRTEFPASSK